MFLDLVYKSPLTDFDFLLQIHLYSQQYNLVTSSLLFESFHIRPNFQPPYQTVPSPTFSGILIRSLNGEIESRENWTLAQNRRLDWVGGGDANPTHHLYALRARFARFFFRVRTYRGVPNTTKSTFYCAYSISCFRCRHNALKEHCIFLLLIQN